MGLALPDIDDGCCAAYLRTGTEKSEHSVRVVEAANP
ncbi:hypothetical protein RSal33209_2374 [Renibacterium salmoninarum ATCC 33209]|uniref:Uncharacterized protein n=1 Tax=Renibacterium salmoninarum (strain ATCC 33209 / DSM 20767 / JCM 11484 / NBRC 15589 / NCIMB 2235) TaxID=288705 RepID=A9WR91_RENSM|nr:hypothetical protein RSal33209_2374 [Renibacterium salmoninarum ATCC 33209]